MRPAVALERQRPGRPIQNHHKRLDGRLHLLAKYEKCNKMSSLLKNDVEEGESLYHCKTCVEKSFFYTSRPMF